MGTSFPVVKEVPLVQSYSYSRNSRTSSTSRGFLCIKTKEPEFMGSYAGRNRPLCVAVSERLI